MRAVTGNVLLMDFNEYQRRAGETAIYPGKGTVMGLAYVGLGLGEAGEVQGKIKKILRDNGGVIDDVGRIMIMKELGDVLWYASQIADELNIDLTAVAEFNLNKLADRAERGVLQGSGDDR